MYWHYISSPSIIEVFKWALSMQGSHDEHGRRARLRGFHTVLDT